MLYLAFGYERVFVLLGEGSGLTPNGGVMPPGGDSFFCPTAPADDTGGTGSGCPMCSWWTLLGTFIFRCGRAAVALFTVC